MGPHGKSSGQCEPCCNQNIAVLPPKNTQKNRACLEPGDVFCANGRFYVFVHGVGGGRFGIVLNCGGEIHYNQIPETVDVYRVTQVERI